MRFQTQTSLTYSVRAGSQILVGLGSCGTQVISGLTTYVSMLDMDTGGSTLAMRLLNPLLVWITVLLLKLPYGMYQMIVNHVVVILHY
jgi:hypothetical protein